MKISKKKETRSRIFTRCRLLSCIIYLLCIFVFTYEAKADEEIPEAAFGSVEVYNYILEIADANSDGILTKAEAEEVTEIDLQNKNITSIKGLEYCINTTNIYLNHNSGLSDISPLANMNKIKDVRIRNTSVKNISCLAGKQELEQVLMDASLVDDISPLTGLNNLKHLEISCTKVKDISVLSTLSGLTNLDVYMCEVKDFSAVSSLTNLVEFIASETDFRDISVLLGSSDTLETIRLTAAKISDISLITSFKNLKKLELTENNISVCPDLSELRKLETLWLNVNELSSVPGVSELTNLKSLELSINKFEELPDISKLTKLETFYCGHNLLTKFPNLSNHTLLENFSITGNYIPDMSTDEVYALLPASITSAPGWEDTIGIHTQTGYDDEENNGGDDEGLDGSEHRDVVSDSGDNVIISGNLQEGIFVKGEEIKDITEYQYIVDYIKGEVDTILDIKIYDIFMYEKENSDVISIVQPNGSVEVKIKVDKTNHKYYVYRQENDGRIMYLESQIKDGYLCFESDHFSIFTVVMSELFGDDETTLNNSDDLSNSDVDNEGKPLDKESENDLFYMCMAIVGIVIVFVVIYQIGIRRGKKDREEEKDINNMLG